MLQPVPIGAYRYPFTPYPRGWYFVAELSQLHKRPQYQTKWCGEIATVTATNYGRACCKIGQLTLPTFVLGNCLFAYYGKGVPFLQEVPAIAEFSSSEWLRPFHLKFVCRTHVQEVAENALDMAHFSRVHEYIGDPKLEHFSLDGPKFTVRMRARRRVLHVIDEPLMEITYFGMGIVQAEIWAKTVHLKVLLTNTPIDEQHIIVHQWIAIKKKHFLRDVVYRLVLPHIVDREFAHDLPVWQHKVYREHPAICGKEGDIMRIRRWAEQFY